MCLQRSHQVCNAARRPRRVFMLEAETYPTQQYILYTTFHQQGLHKRLAVTKAHDRPFRWQGGLRPSRDVPWSDEVQWEIFQHPQPEAILYLLMSLFLK